jgi:hypothetical protein
MRVSDFGRAVSRAIFACALLAIFPALAGAQKAGQVGSLDLLLGFGSGWGGKHYSRGAVAADLTIVMPHRSRWFGGLTLGGDSGFPPGGDCRIEPDTLRCVSPFPGSLHVALLAGVEHASGYDAVRLMAGPALFFSDGAGRGAVVRVDGAAGFGHVAVIGALQTTIDVRTHETIGRGTFLFGIRIQ